MFRIPPSPGDTIPIPTGETALHIELLAEQAASLGRAGRAIQDALARLRAVPSQSPGRPGLVIAAAGAVHAYLIQQELMGIHTRGNYDAVVQGFGIPREVMAKIGVRA